MTTTKGYREAMRALLERKGRPVQFSERDVEMYPNSPDLHVSTYGWIDDNADTHCRPVDKWGGDGCTWVVLRGAKVVERTYSQFVDTEADNKNEVGINVSPVHCACGRYKDMTLRYTASLAETIRELTDTESEGFTL